jgi:UDP-glucose 4-epimerase
MTDRVLVTGAAGFVGRHLIDRLAGEVPVVATDVDPDPPDRYANRVGDGVEYVVGDLTEESFRESLLDREYDRVFHLAAVVGVDRYVENPLRVTETNVIVTTRLLESLRDRDVRFVFTSTSEVYGKNPDVPWDESADRVLGPSTVNRWSYSVSKSACEHMLLGLGQGSDGFEPTIVRPFNLYGPGQRPDFAIPAFAKRVVEGDVPLVYDAGTQTRCFTYVTDFVEGMVRASGRPEAVGEVFNLGSTREVTIRDLADLVLEAAGRGDRSPEFVDTDELYGDEYEDLQRRVPDVSKAADRLDWSAETPLEEGVEQVLADMRARYGAG